MRPALSVTFLVILFSCRGDASVCQTDVAFKNWSQALKSCQRAVTEGASDDTVRNLMRAFFYTENNAEASRLARHLLDSKWKGDAHFILGSIALEARTFDDAVAHFKAAQAEHEKLHDEAGLARDAHGLAGVWRKMGRLVDARHALEMCSAAAQRAKDAPLQTYAEIGLADVLRAGGDYRAAEHALARASKSASDAEKPWVNLKQGILFIDEGVPVLARGPLNAAARSVRQNGAVPSRAISAAALLNLSWVERKMGHWRQALALVAEAASDGEEGFQLHLNRGLALADGQQFEQAAQELKLASNEDLPGEWAWWVAFNQGLVAEQLGNPDAESAYRRATMAVLALHRNAGRAAPQLLASHRRPFSRLFGLLLRQHRLMEAVELVAALDEGAMVTTLQSPDAMANPAPPLPASPRTPSRLVSSIEILEAWKLRRLVVLMSDEVRMWRLELSRGTLLATDVGAADELERLAGQLEASRGEALPAANALGVALMPVGEDGDVPTEFLLVGAIGRTPLAALRREDELVLTHRPMTRVLGIVPRLPKPNAVGAPVVLGDATGTLPGARAEAVAVAEALGVRPLLGASVTAKRFHEATTQAALLHVATHGDIDLSGAYLQLSDAQIRADEIGQSKLAPSLVVLASCGSSSARDEAGWGSLAGAFLSSGARYVLASPWSLDDARALELGKLFYQQGGAFNPPKALAATQLRLSQQRGARDWSGYVVLASPPTAIETQ